jgi:hypothetical protein
MKQLMIAGVLTLGLAVPAAAQMGAGPIARADFLMRGKAQFAEADANHDGAITKEELTAVVTKGMGSAPPPQMIDQIFTAMDGNGDGKATEAEIETMQLARFDKWDTNHDGTLTPEEAQAGRAAMMAAQQPK